MTRPVMQPAIRLPLAGLTRWTLGAAAGATLLALAVALAWDFGRSTDHAVAAALAGLSVITAAAAELVLLGLLPATPLVTWAFRILGCSITRLVTSVALASACFLLIRPAWLPFWGSFLLISVAAIAAQTWAAVVTLAGAAPDGSIASAHERRGLA